MRTGASISVSRTSVQNFVIHTLSTCYHQFCILLFSSVAVRLAVMSVLSRSAAVILIAMLIGAVFSFTPAIVGALNSPVATDDAFNGSEGATLTVPAPGVLANDDDGDLGGYLPITAVTLVDAPSVAGAFSLGNDGSISFTATDTDFNGVVTFTYTVTDDETFVSAPATVTLTIDPENDAPIATNQSVATESDTATTSALTASDIDTGNVLTYATSSDPLHGTIVLDAITGVFTYTPESAYVGSDSFTWHTFDGSASSSDATVTIDVVAVPDPQIGISFVVVSNNGVIGTTSDSALFDGATTTGATTTTTVGAHTVSAIPLDGYTTTIGGDCAADGTITLMGGETKHCVITYTQTGSPITVEPEKPANGPFSTVGPSFGTISNFSGSVLGASTTVATSSLPELPVGCTPMLNGFFRKERIQNDSDEVKKLQQFLNEKMQANLPLTGEFGAGTDAAVKQFQLAHAEQILSPWGISEPTGFVYLTTQRWINLMSCATLDIPMPKLVPYRG